MKNILLLTSLDTTLALKIALEKITAGYGPVCSVRKFYFKDYESPDIPLDDIREALASADIIVIDTRSDTRVSRALTGLLAGVKKTVVVLVGVTPEIFSLTRMGKFSGAVMFKNAGDKEFTIESYVKTKRFSGLTKMLGRLLPVGMLKDMRVWVLCQEYYSEGGEKNLENLLLLLLKEYGGQKQIRKVPPPEVRPGFGMCCPDGAAYTDRAAYASAMGHTAGLPLVGVLVHGGMYFRDSLPVIAALHERLKTQVNLLFIFSMVEYNLDALNAHCAGIDLLVTLQYFRLWGGPYGGSSDATYAFLQKHDVPLLIGLRAFETDRLAWQAGDRGINPIETTLGVILPELDGAIEPRLVSTLDAYADDALGTVKAPAVIDERVDRLCSRIISWLNLRRRDNGAKKLALITYSYPPGEVSLASAGYLDVFASLAVFLEKLKSRGYRVELPDGDMKTFFLENGIVNSPNYQSKQGLRIPAATYRGWFEQLPPQARQSVIERWGEPPGEIMVEGGDLLLPGAMLGNIFLGVQPTRGVHENDEASYHDKALPPHHQYLAFYLFLEKSFGADAVVHFGMHGTLEFLQGKEVGLSGNCFPDLLIGAMPHLYYYWIGNPAEATIAKRRSYALCISHASPVMKAAGLYEKYLLLEDLLNQYRDSPTQEVLALLEKTASELHLPPDCETLGRELYKLKNRLIPYGLHVMDKKQSQDELCDYITGVLQFDRELPSLMKAVAAKNGLSWDAVKNNPQAEAVIVEARQAVADVLRGSAPAWLDPAYTDYIEHVAAHLQTAAESDGLLRAMEGRYILPA
ncbi:MAG: cobaltochelatase subunit CobN, partial [Deltaproteobacteria bacterium]|nr:cobaltochelatase subunit CobN [Deltaproteobacteria bacterium]